MALPRDLSGLGMGPFLATRLGCNVRTVTAQGASRASALQIGGNDYLVCAIGSNGGNGVVLPAVGGDNGCLLGDEFLIVNGNTDTLTVYAPTSNTGIFASAGNNSLFVIGTNLAALVKPITASQFVGMKGS